jgi:predicted Rossmann-fold nucleotide-binding protein
LLNVSGYFDSLLAMLDHAVAERFLRPAHRDLVIADSDADSLLQRLTSFAPVQAGKWANATGNFL